MKIFKEANTEALFFVAGVLCAFILAALPLSLAEAGNYDYNYSYNWNAMPYYGYYNSNPYQYSYNNYQYYPGYPYFPYNYYYQSYNYVPPRCTITLTALSYYNNNYYYGNNYYNYGNYYPYGYGYSNWYPYGGYGSYQYNTNYNYYNYPMQLSWSSSNAYSASISGLGSVGLSGSQIVYPNNQYGQYGQSYIMTVNGPGGVYTCSTGNY